MSKDDITKIKELYNLERFEDALSIISSLELTELDLRVYKALCLNKLGRKEESKVLSDEAERELILKIKDLEHKIDLTQRKLDSSKKSSEYENKSQKNTDSEIERLESQVKILQERKASAEENLSDLSENICILEDEIESLKAHEIELDREVSAARAEYDSKMRSYESVTARTESKSFEFCDLKAKERKFQKLEEEIARLEEIRARLDAGDISGIPEEYYRSETISVRAGSSSGNRSGAIAGGVAGGIAGFAVGGPAGAVIGGIVGIFGGGSCGGGRPKYVDKTIYHFLKQDDLLGLYDDEDNLIAEIFNVEHKGLKFCVGFSRERKKFNPEDLLRKFLKSEKVGEELKEITRKMEESLSEMKSEESSYISSRAVKVEARVKLQQKLLELDDKRKEKQELESEVISTDTLLSLCSSQKEFLECRRVESITLDAKNFTAITECEAELEELRKDFEESESSYRLISEDRREAFDSMIEKFKSEDEFFSRIAERYRVEDHKFSVIELYKILKEIREKFGEDSSSYTENILGFISTINEKIEEFTKNHKQEMLLYKFIKIFEEKGTQENFAKIYVNSFAGDEDQQRLIDILENLMDCDRKMILERAFTVGRLDVIVDELSREDFTAYEITVRGETKSIFEHIENMPEESKSEIIHELPDFFLEQSTSIPESCSAIRRIIDSFGGESLADTITYEELIAQRPEYADDLRAIIENLGDQRVFHGHDS